MRSHRKDIVLFRSKKWYGEGLRSHGYGKNHPDRSKTGPEIGRYFFQSNEENFNSYFCGKFVVFYSSLENECVHTGTISYHSGPKSGTEKGCVHTSTEKSTDRSQEVQKLGSTSFNLMKKISFLTSVGSLSYFTAPWKPNVFTQERYHTVPVQKVVRRRVAFTWVRKSQPDHSKTDPEIGR